MLPSKESGPLASRSGSSSLLSEDDLYLWNQGTHRRLFEKMGAQIGDGGTHFAVWAPAADRVSVIGDWNDWTPDVDSLAPRGVSGIWEGFVGGVGHTATYKYRIVNGDYEVSKSDPFGFHHETPPRTASKVWDLSYDWSDDSWMASRAERNSLSAPLSVYEVHLGSWRRGEDGRFLTYVDLAELLPRYVSSLGFTHVEFLPVMEHPFYGSWGYQTTGYFAPTSRFGTPQDFMALVDALHEVGVGVILDWVPSHFPSDEHGLAYFDGTHLFEHADPRQGFHPDWKTLVYNYGRTEVASFLISSALFWLDVYHADGLRVDAVASMLYLDYSRDDGGWVPNRHGGNENLEAIEFLRAMNSEVYAYHPDTQTIAEESTAWPMVSRPAFLGGLGFGLKWDMGWMHDNLEFLAKDPIYRSFHHHQMTFRAMYAFSENFVLPLSHDEVVHGKRSLLFKMPGDQWQMFANLRLLLSMMYTQPGKKLLFMGSEIGQRSEWNHESELEWGLLDSAEHAGVSSLVADLNHVYRDTPALHELDCDPAGFEWAEPNDAVRGVIAYFRISSSGNRALIVHNLTPQPQFGYQIGVPRAGSWVELLNTDADHYGGSGVGNLGRVQTVVPPRPHHDRAESLLVSVPPLATVIFAEDATGQTVADEEE